MGAPLKDLQREQSGQGSEAGGQGVICREKMPLHQLSEGFIDHWPRRRREIGGKGMEESRGKGGGLKGLQASLQLNRSAGTR